MNITDTLTEARLNAEAATILIEDDVIQQRLFGVLGLVGTISITYTAYRVLRGFVKFVF